MEVSSPLALTVTTCGGTQPQKTPLAFKHTQWCTIENVGYVESNMCLSIDYGTIHPIPSMLRYSFLSHLDLDYIYNHHVFGLLPSVWFVFFWHIKQLSS